MSHVQSHSIFLGTFSKNVSVTKKHSNGAAVTWTGYAQSDYFFTLSEVIFCYYHYCYHICSSSYALIQALETTQYFKKYIETYLTAKKEGQGDSGGELGVDK